jgi:hypothetical protein
MSSNTVETLRPVAGPGRIGQATAVEQSRAVAEVQAAVIVAQQCPRSVPAAISAMEEACAQTELAARAFFRFPRGGETVSGPSVYLARELARCWGNVQHGVTELARDDVHGQSEMQAWAWDVQTNTRSSSTFIVPHKRDTRGGAKELTDMRDIYENNANNGARRLREAIFSVLPAWYSARAQTLCQQTIENGGGRPLAQRIADALKAFERYRVSPGRIAAKFGYAGVDELTAADVAQLGVIYDSLKQGTVTVDDEFPAEAARIAPDELAKPAKPAQARPAAEKPKDATDAASGDTDPAPAPEAAQDRRPALIASGQRRQINDQRERLLFADEGEDVQKWLDAVAWAAGLSSIAGVGDLTQQQAAQAIPRLKSMSDANELLDRVRSAPVRAAAQDGADDGE